MRIFEHDFYALVMTVAGVGVATALALSQLWQGNVDGAVTALIAAIMILLIREVTEDHG